MSAVQPTQRSSSFLRSVRRAVLDDFEAEVQLCEKVALLRACGFKPSEIRRKLDYATPSEVRLAETRVKAAAEHLDAG
jgi:hypothetical protein